MADKTFLKWLSGSVIKQGDTSSVFRLLLMTESKVELSGPGTLRLINGEKQKITFDVEIVNSVVEFRLDTPLPVGSYVIEVDHAGYIFPSTNSTVITVNETLADVVTTEVAKMEKLSIRDEVKRQLSNLPLPNAPEELPDLVALYNISKI